MKKQIAVSILALLSISFICPAQVSPEQQVQHVVTKFFDALSARDASAVREHCTADVRFYEYGQAWTIDTLINLAVTKNTAEDFKRVNTLDFIRTTIRNDVAWTTYKLHSSITRNGKQVEVNWLETVVLISDKKRWKVSVLHSTRTDKP